MQIDLILYERLAHWYRVLAAHLAEKPIRLVETRTADEMEQALDRSALPLVLIDLGDHPERALGVLERAARHRSEPIILVLVPQADPHLECVARELGVGDVLTRDVTPPELLALLQRWVLVLIRRLEKGGWYPVVKPRSPADELLDLALNSSSET
jgi:DNA-binding response OmpR family regulator